MKAADVVLEAVSQGDVTDQSTLLGLLRSRGIEMEQSSLSRLLKRLGIRKREGRYTREPLGRDLGAAPVARAEVLKIVASPPNLLVVRTLPGHAHALGYRIDALGIPDLAGTVAGDDTMLVAVSNPAELHRVKADLERLVMRGF